MQASQLLQTRCRHLRHDRLHHLPSRDHTEAINIKRGVEADQALVKAIVTGNHPVELTAESLIKRTDLPLVWNQQRERFGVF